MPIDMSAVKAPPSKRTGPTAKPTTTGKLPPPSNAKTPNEMRRDGLIGIGSLAQGGCVIFGLHADAAAIGRHWTNVAAELANVADENEAIAKPIDFLIQIGPYGALITAVLPLALQIAANHKLVDATSLANQGVVPPAVLEAQMKAEIAQLQAMALQEQQRAVREAQAAQAEYEAMMAEARNDMASQMTVVTSEVVTT